MIESNDFNDEDEIQVTIRLLFKGLNLGSITWNLTKFIAFDVIDVDKKNECLQEV